MNTRRFDLPNFGKELRIEQCGEEVHLIFVAKSQSQSDSMCDELFRLLKTGELNLTLTAKPAGVHEG